MDDTTFRILDTLSRELGRPVSINALTRRIRGIHRTAYYANIYRKLKVLARDGIIGLTIVGRDTIATLNFKQYALIDLLAEMEMRRKREFLQPRTELQMLFLEGDSYLMDLNFIRSISIVDPEKNAKLNKVELLILLRNSKAGHNEIVAIHKVMQTLQGIHNIRIDYLTLGRDELAELVKSVERNPLKEMLSNKIAFLSPQAFWLEMKDLIDKGISVKIEDAQTSPAKISEQDLAFNLARFGYKEIGSEIRQSDHICIEYVVTSILMRNDARRIQAIPIILAKKKANYHVLIFLSQKYGVSARMLGLLEALYRIKHKKEVGAAIRILEAMKIGKIKADEKSIKERMRLYNVA